MDGSRMEILPRLRQHRLWLACVSLALGLPWLALTGNRPCPLLAARAFARTADAHGCCPRCCPPSGGLSSSAPVPPTPAGLCCVPFKACLPANVAGSKPGELRALGSPRDRTIFPDPLLFDPAETLVVTSLPTASRPVPPPGAFLRTVVRRCCPSHAPPAAAALPS